MKNKITLIFTLTFILLSLSFISSAININTLYPPSSPWVTNQSKINLSYSIYSDEPITKITHSWNDVNTTLIDYSTQMVCNFDNRDGLGENNTRVVCWSPNGDVVGDLFGNYSFFDDINRKGLSFNGSFGFLNTSLDILKLDNNGFTISFWYRPSIISPDLNLFTTPGGFILRANSFGLLFYANASLSLQYNNIFSLGNFTHIVFEFNNSNGFTKLYADGVLKTSASSYSTNGSLSGSGILSLGYSYFFGSSLNGSVDDIIVLNRTLSPEEVSRLYNSQITKYNESYLEYNVTDNTNSALGVNHFLCSTNSTGSNFCSETGLIKEVDEIKSNFSTSKGIINNDFYGVNTHGIWGSKYSWIDVNGDYILDTKSDYIVHRKNLINSNIKLIRSDMSLHRVSLAEGVFDNTSNYDNYRNINTRKNLVSWAKENDIKIIFFSGFMPKWLADNNSGFCNKIPTEYSGSDWMTCSPTNYTKWGELVVNFLREVDCDSNTCMIEVWNEPDLMSFWLSNLSYTNPIRSIEYNKLYNATYDAVKSAYPTMEVGGPATTGTDSNTQLIMLNWMGNFSDKIDFVSHHDYGVKNMDNLFDNILLEDYFWIFNNITSYNVNTSKIYLSEYNLDNNLIKENYTNLWTMQLALSYSGTLCSYPNNISLIPYRWSHERKISVSPERNYWQMFSESGLDNTFFASYNVTKNFAHLCPAGAEVYETSSDSDEIKQVSCKKDDLYSLILINTVNESKNITLDLDGNYPYSNIIDYEDETIYKLNLENKVNLGVIDGYDVVYLYSGFGNELKGHYSLNENTGNKVYDKLKTSNSGTISGATWKNDNKFKTLGSGDYTLDKSKGIFTFVNTDYFYNYLLLSYGYNKIFGFHVSILNVLAGFLMIVILVVAIIYVTRYIQGIKEVE